jgi:hypothetical protein
MVVRGECHRRSEQPGSGAIRDHSVVGHQQSEASQPSPESVSQLRYVVGAAERMSQIPRRHEPGKKLVVGPHVPGFGAAERAVDREQRRVVQPARWIAESEIARHGTTLEVRIRARQWIRESCG